MLGHFPDTSHAGTCVDSEELFSLGTVRRFQSSRMYRIAAASMATSQIAKASPGGRYPATVAPVGL